MPTYRKLIRPHVDTIWKPTDTEPGELVGDYEGTEAGDYGVLFLFRESHGRLRKVPDWPCMKDFAAQLEVGHRYRLTFVKMVPLKNGKQTRDIDVEEVVDDDEGQDAPRGTALVPDDEVPF